MKKLFLLGLLGLNGGIGASLGAIYSSFTQLSEIEKLFKVIKKQILDFSKNHPIKKEDLLNLRKIPDKENPQKLKDVCAEDTLLKVEKSKVDTKHIKNHELIMKILFLPGVWLLEDVNYELLNNHQNTLNLFIDVWFDLIIFYLTDPKNSWEDVEKFSDTLTRDKLKNLSSNKFESIYKNMQKFAELVNIEWNKGLSFVPYLIEIQGILISQLNGEKFFTKPQEKLITHNTK